MKTVQNNRILKESSNFTDYAFGIRNEDLAHIFSVLRNQMYSDKVLAVIREYSTNAYDAHIDAGIKHVPIRVTLPSNIFPEFKVRDYGLGLSEEDIGKVYAFYGRSTKRDSNETVGQLGFGSKSAFAYGDNFVITSYHGGLKTVYNAVIDTTQIGKISKLYQEPMKSDDRTGVEITVPIKSSDYNSFEVKARSFYAYWDVLPDIPGFDSASFSKIRDVILEKGDWKIMANHRSSSSRLNAVMGNVTYPINVTILREKFNNKNVELIERFLNQNNNALLIRFDIGDLEVSSSRENLQYSDHTYSSLIAKLNNVVDHIKSAILEEFNKCENLWQAMALYDEFFNAYGSKFYGLQSSLKIEWRNIPITGNRFGQMNRWCNYHGHISEKQYHLLQSTNTNTNFSGVMTIATSRNNGWRLRPCTLYNSYDIVVSNSTMIVLNDIPKVSLLTKCINKVVSKVVSKTFGDIRTVYILKFTKPDLYDEFVKHHNFEHIPIHKLSDVFAEVKEENRRARKPASEFASVKSINLSTQFHSRYHRNRTEDYWTDDTVDIRNVKGYYIDIEFNRPQYNNREFSLLDVVNVVHHLNKHYSANINPQATLYGFNKKNRTSTGFKSNQKNWTNVFSIAESHVNDARKDNGYNKYMAYRSIIQSNSFSIPFRYVSHIYENLTDKTTVFARLLEEINTEICAKINNFDHIQYLETALSVPSNGEHQDEVTQHVVRYKDAFDKVQSTYKLLNQLSYARSWHTNTVNMEHLNFIIEYVNMVDKLNSVK